ncbi:trwN protein [Bartonella sp. CB175]|uniref:trwN protein n=1 Tax=Bartonella sp. CB175 TaxID=3112256 RepID=UPI00300DC38F
MTVLNPMMLATLCIPTAIYSTIFSTVVMYESLRSIYALGVDGRRGRLCRSPSYKKIGISVDQLNYNQYNLYIGLERSDIRDLKWLRFSLFGLFDLYKKLKAVRDIIICFYECAGSKYNSKKTRLQTALSCYNIKDVKRGFVSAYGERVSSCVGVEFSTSQSLNGQLRGFMQLQTKVQKQTVIMNLFAVSPKELVDMFQQTTGSLCDAFTAEDCSLFRKWQKEHF